MELVVASATGYDACFFSAVSTYDEEQCCWLKLTFASKLYGNWYQE